MAIEQIDLESDAAEYAHRTMPRDVASMSAEIRDCWEMARRRGLAPEGDRLGIGREIRYGAERGSTDRNIPTRGQANPIRMLV